MTLESHSGSSKEPPKPVYPGRAGRLHPQADSGAIERRARSSLLFGVVQGVFGLHLQVLESFVVGGSSSSSVGHISDLSSLDLDYFGDIAAHLTR